MRGKLSVVAGTVLALGVATAASAQMGGADKPISVEIRAAAVLPTFDIADAADLGFGGGVGVGYQVAEKIRLMADFDVGIHGTPVADFNINTFHYMAKVGYDVVQQDNLVLTLNLGAGAVSFGGDLPSTETYFAINAGAKLGIKVSPSLEVLISPQGDIAFSDEAEVGTSNSWVWPLGAGLRIKF